MRSVRWYGTIRSLADLRGQGMLELLEFVLRLQ